jgi:hypothetical protein
VNNTNQDKQEDLDAQHADDTVEQRSNAEMDDPGQLMHKLAMTKELNGWNLLQSLHDQMCRQNPRYHCHVAELLLYLIPYLIIVQTI